MTIIRDVTVTGSALPTGASTSAKQDTGNASLASIDAKTPTLSGGAVPVTGALTDAQLRATPVPVSGTVTVTGAGDATAANQTALNTLTGAVNETAPATDTASSGLNGRLQRIAQRITSLITAIGSPFQAGGSIGNTAFGVNNGAGASAVNIQDGGNSITVDGTFWQATQPVSIAATVTTNAIQSGPWSVSSVQSGPWTVDASCSQNGSWTVAATQSGGWTVTGAGGTFPVTDSGGSLTVDAPVGTPVFVRLSDGAAAITTLPVSIAASVAVTGPLTDSQLRASAVPVSGTFFQATQPVSNAGTFAVQAAQSGTWVLGANSGVDIGDVTINNASGASAVNIQDGGNSITVDGTVAATQSGTWTVTGTGGTFPVTDNGGSLTIDAPVGTPAFVRLSDGAAAITTLPVSLATLPALVAGTAVVGKVGIDQTTPGTTNLVALSAETTKVIGTVNPPAITIGTNSANGFTVQRTVDAGRTPVHYYAVAAAAGTTGTETAITLTKSSANAATSTGTSFVITSGKRYRIQAITFATRGNNTATAQTTTFKFRVNTAGAVTTGSTPIELAMRSATPATANAWDRVFVQIPDGWEITGDGTLQFGVTAAATYVTNAPTWDVTIIGFEY